MTVRMAVLASMIFTVVGCGSPKVSVAGNYVEMKTELAKLDLYKKQIASLKDSLTDVPTNIYSKDWKYRETNVGKLDYYLTNNDCLKAEDFARCYLQTRLLLITTTKELDASIDLINGAYQVIDKLMSNINVVIDNLSDDKAEEQNRLLKKLTK